MRADHAAKIAVEVVWRAVHLIDVAQRRDLHALAKAVPDHVDDADIHGIMFEEGTKFAPAVQRLGRGDRAGGHALDASQRRGIMLVDLQPGQIEGGHYFGHPLEALGLEVEIGVEVNAHLRSNRISDRAEMRRELPQQGVIPVQLRPAGMPAEARRILIQSALTVGDQDIGLQRPEATGLDLCGMAGDVVTGLQWRHPQPLRVAHPVTAEMRPVDRDPPADRAAEQGIDGNAARPGGDVEQGVLHRRDGLLVQATARLPCHHMQPGRDLFPGAGVAPDDERGKAFDHPGQAGRAKAFAVFGPTHQPLIGGDFEEGEEPPAGIGTQRLDAGDLHARSSPVFPVADQHGRRGSTRRPAGASLVPNW